MDLPGRRYLRLRTLPSEQCQIDWGHFGHIQIGHARRPLMGFVTVLSWSRQIFLRFYLDARMENFLRGHVAAFEAWGGIPRIALYDYVAGNIIIQSDPGNTAPCLEGGDMAAQEILHAGVQIKAQEDLPRPG